MPHVIIQYTLNIDADMDVIGITLQIDESPGQVYDAKHNNLHPLCNK